MIGWIIVVAVTALLSYLADVGVLDLLNRPVPFFGGSIISIILMVTCIIMLLRAVKMNKKGEKERLQELVDALEKELKEASQAASEEFKKGAE